MSTDIDINVIHTTQEVLSKHIKKPPLTEKLLRKPPFRFLHDVITNIIRETGFLKGLYSERELASENVKEKDDKIAFLNKLIEATKTITGMDLAVRPSKVIAGFEPYQTNILLQAIGSALEQKMDSSEYVSQLKLQKQASKKQENVKDTDKKLKPTKTREKTLKNTKENLVKNKSNVSTKALDTKLNSKRSSSRDSKATGGGDNKTEKKLKQKKEVSDQKNKNNTIEEQPNVTQLNLQNQEIKSKTLKEDIEENKRLTSQQTHNVTEGPMKEIHMIKPHLPVTETLSEQPLLEIKDVQKTIEQNEDEDNLSTFPVSMPEKVEVSETNNVAEPAIIEKENKQKLPISRPKSALRPVSVRPSSARPGAPRLLRSDSILLKEKEVVPSGKVEVIDETSTNNYVDEEETVTIETAAEVEYQAPVLQLPTDKGHLVEQILQQINSSDIEPVKSNMNVEWEQAGLRNRNTALKEVEQLKSAIQDLTKMVNPLGKLINYMHEDIEAMYSELDMWNSSVRQIMHEVVNQKKVRDESNVPLQIKLNEIEENIVKHQQQIMSTYSDIMRNEERIQDLLIK